MITALATSFKITTLLLLLLFGSFVVRFELASLGKKVLLFFLWCNVCYLLAYSSFIQQVPVLFFVLLFFSVSLPYSFWLLSKVWFRDSFVWTKQLSIFLGIAMPAHYILYQLNAIIDSPYYTPFHFLPYLLSLVVIGLVIYESLVNRNSDLVTNRLRIRTIFMLVAALMAVGAIGFFFFGSPIQLPDWYELLQSIFSSLFIFWLFSSQIQWKNIFSDPKTIALKTNQKQEIQQKLMDKLLALFQTQRTYTTEGITITELARLLQEKEYLVRKTINGELGYTNFNSFINHYRIKDACQIIRQNQDSRMTFQEIAFDLGYQSIATFNRAFKKETGLTPSQFLNQYREN